MLYLYIFTGAALLFSLAASPQKTAAALRIAWKRFGKVLPAFLVMLISVSAVLYLVPGETISRTLAENNPTVGLLLAALLGSLTYMPGFIVFPLCGILLAKGVSYMVLSAFSTTLMMVGVLTFPLEKEYFGTRITIIRNLLGLLIALVVALVTGAVFGEI